MQAYGIYALTINALMVIRGTGLKCQNLHMKSEIPYIPRTSLHNTPRIGFPVISTFRGNVCEIDDKYCSDAHLDCRNGFNGVDYPGAVPWWCLATPRLLLLSNLYHDDIVTYAYIKATCNASHAVETCRSAPQPQRKKMLPMQWIGQIVQM